MRSYIELIEISPPEAIAEGDFIRIDITDWDVMDIDEIINLLKLHAEKSYENYILQLHLCRHDESRSCEVKVLVSK